MAVVSLPAKLAPLARYYEVLHCTIRFDVYVQWPHYVGILLLAFGKIVKQVLSTLIDSAIHTFFNALSRKLSKCSKFVAQLFAAREIFRCFVEDRFHVRDFACPCKEEKDIFNHTNPADIFSRFNESEFLPKT